MDAKLGILRLKDHIAVIEPERGSFRWLSLCVLLGVIRSLALRHGEIRKQAGPQKENVE